MNLATTKDSRSTWLSEEQCLEVRHSNVFWKVVQVSWFENTVSPAAPHSVEITKFHSQFGKNFVKLIIDTN